MCKTLLELIEKENPFNPYTDDQLAAMVGIRREQIVELRKKEGIPNSRTRLKPALIEEIKKYIVDIFQLTKKHLKAYQRMN